MLRIRLIWNSTHFLVMYYLKDTSNWLVKNLRRILKMKDTLTYKTKKPFFPRFVWQKQWLIWHLLLAWKSFPYYNPYYLTSRKRNSELSIVQMTPKHLWKFHAYSNNLIGARKVYLILKSFAMSLTFIKVNPKD